MEDNGIELINFNIEVVHIKAEKEVANHLQIKTGRKIIKLSRLKGHSDGPFVKFISFLHPRIGVTGEEDFRRHLYDILEKRLCLCSLFVQRRN